MSTSAVSVTPTKAPGFWRSTNGKKIVMAVTGVILILFVVGHLLGNLLIYAGPARYNAYAAFLHYDESLLWIVRSVLLVSVILHIEAAAQLWSRKRKARPAGYALKKATTSSYASRTMYWSGPIVLAFIIFHLMEFTAGYIHPGSEFVRGQVYHNVVAGFSVWWISAWYIFSLCLLGLHLRHGLWSMLQSFGLPHTKAREAALKRLALWIAVLLMAGYISIPISVLTGLIK
jgi:succinate dehydrogenase / fumarate reductase cytochrome b subunit